MTNIKSIKICHRLKRFSQISFDILIFISYDKKYDNMMEGYREQETYKIIGICMEVHRILGQ